MRIAPSSLPPHHSDPAARDFQSSIPVEVLLRGCHLDVQGLLQQQFLSFAAVKHCGLLPVDRMVILSCLQSLFGLPDVDLAAAAGDTIYHFGVFAKR